MPGRFGILKDCYLSQGQSQSDSEAQGQVGPRAVALEGPTQMTSRQRGTGPH